MRKTHWIVLVFFVIVGLVVTACGSDQKAATEEVVAVPTVTKPLGEEEDHADDDSVIEGLEEYRGLGCAACHGQDGEGGTGPAVPGHTADQVRRQVRTPKGDIMPAFSQEQLNDGNCSAS